MIFLNDIKQLFRSKLGLCWRCMAIAFLLTVAAWVILAIVALWLHNPILNWVGFLVALGVTILLLAHLIARLVKVVLPIRRALETMNVIDVTLSVDSLDSNEVRIAIDQDGIGLTYEGAVASGKRFYTLKTNDSRELLSVRKIDDKIETTILGGRLTISEPESSYSKEMFSADTDTQSKHFRKYSTVNGDRESLEQLQTNPSFALLGIFSKSFGRLGFSGQSHSAILPLHFLALGAAKFRTDQNGDSQPDGKPDGDGEPEVVYRIRHPFPPINYWELFFGRPDTVDCNPQLPGSDLVLLPGHEELWSGGCGGGSDCPTRGTESCDRYPDCKNGCAGMCGNGCNCWREVCGDCCYHDGCAAHDDWCSGGSLLGILRCVYTAPIAIECRVHPD